MNKKINLLLIEDGSVDVDSLNITGIPKEQVIVYKQNSTKPMVLDVEIDDTKTKYARLYNQLVKELDALLDRERTSHYPTGISVFELSELIKAFKNKELENE